MCAQDCARRCLRVVKNQPTMPKYLAHFFLFGFSFLCVRASMRTSMRTAVIVCEFLTRPKTAAATAAAAAAAAGCFSFSHPHSHMIGGSEHIRTYKAIICSRFFCGAKICYILWLCMCEYASDLKI